MLGIIVEIAITLVFTAIPFPLFQSMICGPTCRFDNNALKSFRDPRAKQYEAIIKNTSPGIRGNIKPMVPIPVKIKPNIIQTCLDKLNFFEFREVIIFKGKTTHKNLFNGFIKYKKPLT